jgi:ribonucleoside-diphosphate reductase alpha chain
MQAAAVIQAISNDHAPSMRAVVQSIRKRDGKVHQPFDTSKLRRAISRAWEEAKGSVDERALNRTLNTVIDALTEEVVCVENVQDAVETALMRQGQFAVAKAFILYRHQRAEARQGRTAKTPDPKAISDYIHAGKYARYLPRQKRREVYSETVARIEGMHLEVYPEMQKEIRWAFDRVREKRVLPSMRSMQFGGQAILANNNRIYNCMGVETEFITTQGVKKFSDFKDGDKITVLTHTGAWKSAVVKSYGTQQLFEVTIGRGRSSFTVRSTRDHQWLLENGERTRDLSVKHKLAKAPRLVGAWDYTEANPEARYYWALGYVYGDGTLVKGREGEPTYSMVRLCGKDKERFLERFKELGFATSSPATFGGDAMAYTGKYLKTLPSIEQDGFENVMAFVRGFLDADGHKNENGDWPSPFNGIQATGGEAIDFIRKVFPAVGAYITREDDLTGQETNFGIRPETSRFGLVLGFGDAPSSPYSVQSIKEAGYETVWCLEVEDDHSFVLPNGIVTGNCSFSLVDRMEVFSEALYLLLSGCGVGYSVQFDHIEKLPAIAYVDPKKVRHHVVQDTIEGWADGLKALVQSFLDGVNLEISYHLIRDAGTPLRTSGGRAPGHLKLKDSLEQIRGVLSGAQGRKLRSVECHRIMCHAADAVLSGGIRRSAMICLFSLDDSEMMHIKTGNWFAKEPWLANSNNSVVLKRDEVKKKQFKRIFNMTRQWGEPGFYFTSDYDYGTNPCCEIGMNPKVVVDAEMQAKFAAKGVTVALGSSHTGWAFCNLCEINAARLTSLEDFKEAARAATIIGTLQAGYTKMPYLGAVSEVIAERESLLGIGMTGMLDAPHIACNPEYQREVAGLIKQWNIELSARIGIRPAARTTCVKPSGTTSLELGCVGSGHHAHHARRYIRRVTADELEPVFQAFKAKNPHMCVRKPDGKYVIEFPVEAPPEATIKDDITAIPFLDMVKSTQQNWVLAGTADSTYSPGLNHNVSNTVTVRPDEWDKVADYLWENREFFTGVSLLASTGDKDYAFAPNEAIVTPVDEARWNAILESYEPLDYTLMVEDSDDTDLKGEVACSGGVCLLV